MKCICKHSEYEHLWGFNLLTGICKVGTCTCDKFKGDNLRYLEECYDRTKNLA